MTPCGDVVNLQMSRQDAALVSLGLSYVILQRLRAGFYAKRLPEDALQHAVDAANADIVTAGRIRLELQAACHVPVNTPATSEANTPPIAEQVH